MIKKALCWLIGHRYVVLKKYSATIRKVGCRRCKRTWGMSDDARALLPWDDELKEASEAL